MIYLGEFWSEVLVNHLCYECFGRLILIDGKPQCPLHKDGMWIHRDRRNLFASIRAKMRRNDGHDNRNRL